MKYSRIISLALFLGLLGLGVWGLARGGFGKDEVAPTLAAGSFLQLDYIKEDSTIKAELAQAERKALLWDSNAKLVAISMRFDGGLDYDFLKRYAYVFQTPGISDYYVFNSAKAVAAAQTYSQAELFGEVQPTEITKDYLKINFVQALEIVERAGGSTFRADHSGNYIVNLLLVQPEGDVLSWVVSYQAKSSDESQVWRVNAASGSVELQ